MVKGKNRRILTKNFFARQVGLVCFVLCVLFAAFFSWKYSKSRETSLQFLDKYGIEHTLYLPAKDKEKLFALMQKLFAEDSFAYTILGSKPVSWETYQNPFPFSDWTIFYDSFSKYNRIVRSGWKTWEKYRHVFPSAHLWVETSERHPGSISILIVNEDQFNIVVKNNKKDFQDVLRKEIVDGFQLLKEAKNRSLMSEVLEGHQALMGMVLGYGRDNSWKFLEGCEKRVSIGWVWGEEDWSFPEELPPGISLIEFYLTRCSCPSFAGDPNSKESLDLKADYLLTKQRVMNYYKDKDFLEATLSLLAGYRPQEGLHFGYFCPSSQKRKINSEEI